MASSCAPNSHVPEGSEDTASKTRHLSDNSRSSADEQDEEDAYNDESDPATPPPYTYMCELEGEQETSTLKSSISHQINTRSVTGRLHKRLRSYSPPDSPPPLKKQVKEPVAKEAACEEVTSMAPVVQNTPETRTRKQWEQWSVQNKDYFFEALNEHGKDFEAMQTWIVQKLKKKDPHIGTRTKDHIRHFYYRTWHKIHKYVKVDDLDDINKQALELYSVINYGELRKKIRNMGRKAGRKLYELVHKGTTSVKIKNKNSRIKTPVCRALKKLHNIEDHTEEEKTKMPERVSVELFPKSNRAWTHIQSISHNPRLRVSARTNKRVSSLLELLAKKWSPEHASIGGMEEGDGLASKKIKLFVPQNCSLTPLHVKCTIPQQKLEFSFDSYLECRKAGVLGASPLVKKVGKGLFADLDEIQFEQPAPCKVPSSPEPCGNSQPGSPDTQHHNNAQTSLNCHVSHCTHCESTVKDRSSACQKYSKTADGSSVEGAAWSNSRSQQCSDSGCPRENSCKHCKGPATCKQRLTYEKQSACPCGQLSADTVGGTIAASVSSANGSVISTSENLAAVVSPGGLISYSGLRSDLLEVVQTSDSAATIPAGISATINSGLNGSDTDGTPPTTQSSVQSVMNSQNHMGRQKHPVSEDGVQTNCQETNQSSRELSDSLRTNKLWSVTNDSPDSNKSWHENSNSSQTAESSTKSNDRLQTATGDGSNDHDESSNSAEHERSNAELAEGKLLCSGLGMQVDGDNNDTGVDSEREDADDQMKQDIAIDKQSNGMNLDGHEDMMDVDESEKVDDPNNFQNRKDNNDPQRGKQDVEEPKEHGPAKDRREREEDRERRAEMERQEAQAKLEKLKRGLTLEDCGNLTLAEVYMMLGCPQTLCFEYEWVNRDGSDDIWELKKKLTNMLRRLVHIATTEFTHFKKDRCDSSQQSPSTREDPLSFSTPPHQKQHRESSPRVLVGTPPLSAVFSPCGTPTRLPESSTPSRTTSPLLIAPSTPTSSKTIEVMLSPEVSQKERSTCSPETRDTAIFKLPTAMPPRIQQARANAQDVSKLAVGGNPNMLSNRRTGQRRMNRNVRRPLVIQRTLLPKTPTPARQIMTLTMLPAMVTPCQTESYIPIAPTTNTLPTQESQTGAKSTSDLVPPATPSTDSMQSAVTTDSIMVGNESNQMYSVIPNIAMNPSSQASTLSNPLVTYTSQGSVDQSDSRPTVSSSARVNTVATRGTSQGTSGRPVRRIVPTLVSTIKGKDSSSLDQSASSGSGSLTDKPLPQDCSQLDDVLPSTSHYSSNVCVLEGNLQESRVNAPSLSTLLDISVPSVSDISDSTDKLLDLALLNSSSSFGALADKESSLSSLLTDAAAPSFSPTKSFKGLSNLTAEDHWLAGEEFSIGSFLHNMPMKKTVSSGVTAVTTASQDNLATPSKMVRGTSQSSTGPVFSLNESSRDSVILGKHDVDTTLQAMMNENSMDYMTKFADLAAQMDGNSALRLHRINNRTQKDKPS